MHKRGQTSSGTSLVKNVVVGFKMYHRWSRKSESNGSHMSLKAVRQKKNFKNREKLNHSNEKAITHTISVDFDILDLFEY